MFERAIIGLEECRSQVVERLDVPEEDIDAALSSAISCQVSLEMFLLTAQLKTSHEVRAPRNLPRLILDGLHQSNKFMMGCFDLSCILQERLPHSNL